MEKVQSSDEVLEPVPADVDEADDVVDAAAAAAAATPAPEAGTDDEPWTSDVCTDRTSRILDIVTADDQMKIHFIQHHGHCCMITYIIL